MDTYDKLRILTEGAKYDVACTSSGVDRPARAGALGSAVAAGICHSFAADGRCISLLKILMTNACIYDCAYCQNRASLDIERACFEPRELCDLVIGFYRRNYIEGLFLSSAVIKSPDYTCERMLKILRLLRGEEYNFNGYIHVKAIPGADEKLLRQIGYLADRMSVNIEFPSEKSLKKLAPDKSKAAIFEPMKMIAGGIAENSRELVRYNHAPKFTPAGQSTQMIIGASPESDRTIINLTEALYQKYKLKRVFYSAYIPVNESSLLPSLETKPPLLREHRLYQADWLLRFYGFKADELLDDQHENFNPLVDPKCSWALAHLDEFPVEVNKAPKDKLLRVPGIGPTSALRIMQARRFATLDFAGLKKIGVVLKRAQYFITAGGRMVEGLRVNENNVLRAMISESGQQRLLAKKYEQVSIFDGSGPPLLHREVMRCLTQ